MSRLKFLSRPFLILLMVFLFAGTVFADGPPPEENGEVDISDPEVVEGLAEDLFDAILEGDGSPLWEEWDEETQDAVVEWVESSASGVVASGQKRDETDPAESDDEASSSGCDTHSVSAIAWVSSRNNRQPVRL